MTEQQIERLEELLEDLMEEPVGVDELNGLFAAVAAGPNLVNVDIWLPILFNEEDLTAIFSSEPQMKALMDLIMTFYNETVQSINDDSFAPFFRYYDDDDTDTPDPEPWCHAFHLGLELHGEDTTAKENTELLTILLPIVYFFDPEAVYQSMVEQTGDLEMTQQEVWEEMLEMIADVVLNVRDHFHPEHRKEGLKPEGRILPFDPPDVN